MGFEFRDLVAIVTGGASGIGAAISHRLASAGAKVAIFDLTAGHTPEGGRSYQVDVTDDDEVRQGILDVAADFGRLDVVINNAGVGAQGTIEDHDDAQWHVLFDINVLGPVRVSRAALPMLRTSPSAAIVNVCSIAATAGLPARALYGTTKGALLSLTLQMAADHLKDGVRVNCVNPGTADTPWVHRLLSTARDPNAERAALESRQPQGRLVSADEVAEAVAYLASPLAGSTTGTSLAVDGGMQGLRLRPRTA